MQGGAEKKNLLVFTNMQVHMCSALPVMWGSSVSSETGEEATVHMNPFVHHDDDDDNDDDDDEGKEMVL